MLAFIINSIQWCRHHAGKDRWASLSPYCGIALLLVLAGGCTTDIRNRNGMDRQVKQPTFSQTVTLRVSEIESKLTARAQALEQAHRALLGEMITLLQVTPAVSQMQLTREQLVNLASVVVQPEIENESWDGTTYVVQAKITIVPPTVVDMLERLQREPHTVDIVDHIRERIDAALRQMAQARQAFRSARNPIEALRFESASIEQYHVLSAMQWFRQGLGHATAQRYLDAVIAFSVVIELVPQEAEAYSQRALAYLALRQHQQALEDVSKTIELQPQEARYVVVRGRIHEDMNAPQRALADFTRAVQIDPQRVSAHLGRGRVFEAMQQYEQAIAAFSKALELAPQRQVAYYNRGIAYSKIGDYEHAIADFSRALELHPDDAAALNNRGALYGLLGDYEQSVQDFSRLIELKPRQVQAYVNRATALEKLGNYAEAIQDYSKILALDPEHREVYFNRGKARLAIGAVEAAVQDLSRVVETQPSRAEAHYLLASAYQRLGNSEAALTHYRTAIQLGLQELIHDAQEKLKAAGFDPGPLDGVMGPRTETAVREYQKANGIPVTGTFDDATIQILFIESASTPQP